MRNYITIVESLLNEYRAPPAGIGFHGTSSKFVPSILKNGFKADPEFKVYTGELESYSGTYFSDTFTVALQKGGNTVESVGGKIVVFICSITEPVAGDEDAITDFLRDDLWDWLSNEGDDFNSKQYLRDAEYREEMNERIKKVFEYTFDESAPEELFQFIWYIENGGQMLDAKGRQFTDIITRKIGPATMSAGNSEAKSFRYTSHIPPAKIIAVVQCTHKDNKYGLDPSYLPRGFSYKAIYGSLTPELKQAIER
jgi:hypothetical protein